MLLQDTVRCDVLQIVLTAAATIAHVLLVVRGERCTPIVGTGSTLNLRQHPRRADPPLLHRNVAHVSTITSNAISATAALNDLRADLQELLVERHRVVRVDRVTRVVLDQLEELFSR